MICQPSKMWVILDLWKQKNLVVKDVDSWGQIWTLLTQKFWAQTSISLPILNLFIWSYKKSIGAYYNSYYKSSGRH